MLPNPDEPITWVDPEEEEADWQPPDLADPASLPDNTKGWLGRKDAGYFYRWKGKSPKRAWPLAVGITREITAPWRRGVGISVSYADNRMTFGVWFRGSAPDHLVEPPPTNLRKVLGRAKRYRARYDIDRPHSNPRKVKE